MAPYDPPAEPAGPVVDAVFNSRSSSRRSSSHLTFSAFKPAVGAGGGGGQPRPVSELPISSAEKQQFQKMIDAGMVDLQAVNDSVAANRASVDKYAFSVLSLVVTAAIIVAYMVFVYRLSFREYKEVIEEKFGLSETSEMG